MFTAFISDLHLSPQRPEVSEIFFRFLAQDATQAQALYILGDLFEVWVGDDTLGDPFNRACADALRGLTQRRVPVYVMCGNRDFLYRRRFVKATGTLLIKDPTVIDLYGTPTLLMHGDSMCIDDIRYQQFRARARNPFIQWGFLHLPLFYRFHLARKARRMSEEEKPGKQKEILDVNASEVQAAFRKHGVRQLIHGHTHRPARHEYVVDGKVYERRVLADWYSHGEYLRVEPGGYSVVQLY